MVRSILLGFSYLLNTVWICFQFYVLQAYNFHDRNDISRNFKAFQFKMDQQNKQTCLSITRYLYIIYSTFTILQIRFLVLKKNHEWLNVVITYLLYSSRNSKKVNKTNLKIFNTHVSILLKYVFFCEFFSLVMKEW